MPGFGLGSFEDIDMKTNKKIYDLKEHAVAKSSVYTHNFSLWKQIFSYEGFSY